MNFSKLLQVVFKERNLLLLGDISPTLIRLQPCTLSTETVEILYQIYGAKTKIKPGDVKMQMLYFSNSSREVLNKELAEVMEGMELTSLRYGGTDRERKEYCI